MGDLNGHSPMSDTVETNNNGKQIEDIIEKFGLAVGNDGSSTRIQTPERGRSGVDVMSSSMAALIDWSLHEDSNHSDHFSTDKTKKQF